MSKSPSEHVTRWPPLPGEETLSLIGFSPAQPAPVTSSARFPDGGAFRVEIPSVEGPLALETVVAEAARRAVPVRRVSQGSGVMMLDDAEIADMAATAGGAGIELCLSWVHGAPGTLAARDSAAAMVPARGRVAGTSSGRRSRTRSGPSRSASAACWSQTKVCCGRSTGFARPEGCRVR